MYQTSRTFARRNVDILHSRRFRWFLTEVCRYVAPNAPTTLRCGVTVVPDRNVKKWRQISIAGHHERDVDRFLADFLRSGDVVFDIGASIGVLTAIAAKTVRPSGVVHSFEVDKASYEHLQRTIKRNKLTNTIVNKIALSDKCGEATFVRPMGSWGAFMLGPTEIDGTENSRRAIDAYFPEEKELVYKSQTTTIDDYVRANSIDRLDLIKIDVDGPEPAIIKGGFDTISRLRPALMAEASMFTLDHGVTFAQLFELLSSMGYWIYAVPRDTEQVYRLFSPDQAPVDIRNEKRAIDLFCRVPGHQDERWDRLWFIKASR